MIFRVNEDETLTPAMPESAVRALQNLIDVTREGGRIERRNAIQAFELENLKLPQVDIPLHNHFVNGMYWRERPVKKGTIITTHIHREANITVIPFGSLVIVSEEEVVRIVGPAMFETHPGTKRVILVEEDSVFSTIHPNPLDVRDVDELEARLTSPDFSFLELEVGQ
jgi:hypothetical protein